MGVVTTLQCKQWLELLDGVLSILDRIAFARLPTTRLLSAILLKEAVGLQRAKRYIQFIYPIMPEINLEGDRRCVYENNNKRCEQYLRNGVLCASHLDEVNMITQHFKSKELRDTYNSFLNSTHKMRLDGEQALMRTMLTQLVKKIQATGDVPMEIISAITIMTEKITKMTQVMSDMNAITPEHVDNILNGVVEIMAQYLPAEKLKEAASKVMKLTNQPATTDLPYEPGATIEINGEIKAIEGNDGIDQQRRAMVSEAQRLKIELDTLKEVERV